MLNAGPGFLSYEWNTSSNEQNIIVSTEGEYSIKATTSDGCEATDTIKVKQFAVPVAGLDRKNQTYVLEKFGHWMPEILILMNGTPVKVQGRYK